MLSRSFKRNNYTLYLEEALNLKLFFLQKALNDRSIYRYSYDDLCPLMFSLKFFFIASSRLIPV